MSLLWGDVYTRALIHPLPPALPHTPYLRKCCIAAIPMKSEETSVHLNIYQPGLLVGTTCVHVTFSPLLPSWYSLSVSIFLCSQHTDVTADKWLLPVPSLHDSGKRARRTAQAFFAPYWLSSFAFVRTGGMRVQCTCVPMYVLCLNVMKQVIKSISHGTSTIQACCFFKCKIRMGNSLCP